MGIVPPTRCDASHLENTKCKSDFRQQHAYPHSGIKNEPHICSPMGKSCKEAKKVDQIPNSPKSLFVGQITWVINGLLQVQVLLDETKPTGHAENCGKTRSFILDPRPIKASFSAGGVQVGIHPPTQPRVTGL